LGILHQEGFQGQGEGAERFTEMNPDGEALVVRRNEKNWDEKQNTADAGI